MKPVLLIAALLSALALPARAVELPDAISAGERTLPASGDQSDHPGKSLYDYIDGDASRFMDHGFRTCASRVYKSGGLEMEIAVYELADSASAFQVFLESCGERNPMAAGKGSYCWGEQIFFCCKGRHYAELTDRGAEKLSHEQSLAAIKTALGLLP
jgi:hypothetical protein